MSSDVTLYSVLSARLLYLVLFVFGSGLSDYHCGQLKGNYRENDLIPVVDCPLIRFQRSQKKSTLERESCRSYCLRVTRARCASGVADSCH